VWFSSSWIRCKARIGHAGHRHWEGDPNRLLVGETAGDVAALAKLTTENRTAFSTIFPQRRPQRLAAISDIQMLSKVESSSGQIREQSIQMQFMDSVASSNGEHVGRVVDQGRSGKNGSGTSTR